MNINQALDRLKSGGPELNAIADAIGAAIPVHAIREIQRLEERVASAADGLRERDREIERLQGALERIKANRYGLQSLIEEGADEKAMAEYWANTAMEYQQIARAALNTEGK